MRIAATFIMAASERGHARGRLRGRQDGQAETERPPGWSRRPAPLGSATFSESRFNPGLDFGLKPANASRSVGTEPYPFGELVSLFKAVDMSKAVQNEIADLFLREQAQFSRHRGHSM